MDSSNNIIKYLHILKCPKDHSDLVLKNSIIKNDQIIEGELISKKDKNIYKISDNIIRFVSSDNYSKSFEMQFKKFKNIQFDQVPKGMANYTKDKFDKITNFAKLNEKIVCEVGTGSGRFINEVLKQKPKLVVALDYSGAIEQLKENIKTNIDIIYVQADASNNPLKDNSIDFVYSIGVLHHTKSAETGFKEMCRILKQNGEACLSIYRKGYYCNLSVTILRKFLNLFDDEMKFKLAYLYATAVFYIIPNFLKRNIVAKFIPFIHLPNKEWSILDTIDSITPVYQSCYTEKEVYDLFERNNMYSIKKVNWGVSHIGKKI